MIKFTPQAAADLESFRKEATLAAKRKLKILYYELMEHPTTGTGKPKALRHSLKGCWSRRINNKDRLVYRIDEDETITIIAIGGHYDDK